MTTKAKKAKIEQPRRDTRSGAAELARLPKEPVESVRTIREGLGLTQENFARLSGLSVRTIAEWEGGRGPTEVRRSRLVEIQRLQKGLAKVMRPEFIGAWLQAPNEGFSGLKPIEVIERGEVDRIWRMIYELESGIPD